MTTCIIVSTKNEDVSVACFFRVLDRNRFGIISVDPSINISRFRNMLELSKICYQQLIFVGNFWQELAQELSLTYTCHIVSDNVISNITKYCGNIDSKYMDIHKDYVNTANIGGQLLRNFVGNILDADNTDNHIKDKYYRYFSRS